MFTGEAVCERNQVFHNGRLDICARLPLLDRHLPLPGRNARRVCRIIHAACFEHREQLARRLKIKRQVRQLIQTNAETQTK